MGRQNSKYLFLLLFPYCITNLFNISNDISGVVS